MPKMDPSKWSMKYDVCIKCGLTTHPYQARGMCRPCYDGVYYATNTNQCKSSAKKRYERDKENHKAKHEEWLSNHPGYRDDYNHKYYRDHQDDLTEYAKKYRKEHPQTYDLGRKRRGLYSSEYWNNRYKLLYVLRESCEKCGSAKKREIHHKIPLIQGGDHNIENLQVLCFSCHRGKGTGIHSVMNDSKVS